MNDCILDKACLLYEVLSKTLQAIEFPSRKTYFCLIVLSAKGFFCLFVFIFFLLFRFAIRFSLCIVPV